LLEPDKSVQARLGAGEIAVGDATGGGQLGAERAVDSDDRDAVAVACEDKRRQRHALASVAVRERVGQVARGDFGHPAGCGQSAEGVVESAGDRHGFIVSVVAATGCRRGYRLRLVVSCSISSTVRMVVAFEE